MPDQGDHRPNRWAKAVLCAGGLALAACSSGDGGVTDGTRPGSATTSVATTQLATTVHGTDAPQTTATPATAASTTQSATTELTTTTQATATTSATAADADRPFDVFVPASYDGSTAVPLVVLLHGYTATGDLQERYFQLQPLAEQRGFLYVHPDGTEDFRGKQFWNATDACCDLGSASVDDSSYLTHVIQQVQATYNVDPRRIFLIGHSNGGFMSYRMACDHADLIAAIVSVSGATFDDPARCQPTQPVSVLEIHGTADTVIAYDGGAIFGNTYPSAATTVDTWAAYDGCGPIGDEVAAQLDLDGDTPGAETSVVSYTECPADGSVELWTVQAGVHSPNISSTFFDDALDFLYAHPKGS